jgi:hypothetical protein
VRGAAEGDRLFTEARNHLGRPFRL